MIHWRARRRLSMLLDGGLGDAERADLNRHLAGCRRCRRHLRELQTADLLVARLPLSVAPLEFDPASHTRLARLALWSDEPAPPDPARWRMPVLGVAGLVVAASLAFSVEAWAPLFQPAGSAFDLAAISQEIAVTPVGWRPGH